MGGEGSGRKPDLFKAMEKQNSQFREGNGQEIFLPNYSGIQKGVLKSTSTSDALILQGDFTVSGQAVVRNILVGTETTPPTASTVSQGTLYIKYTA